MANWCSFITNDGAEDYSVLVNLDEITAINPMTLMDNTEGLRLYASGGTTIVRGSFQDMALMLNAKIIDPA